LTYEIELYILITDEEYKMNFSTAVAEELKGLNDKQLNAIYRYIKSFKKEKPCIDEVISLEEVWKITANSGPSWSKDVEQMREERF
jgi:hypothetical protein